jgi:hypothetical protein
LEFQDILGLEYRSFERLAYELELLRVIFDSGQIIETADCDFPSRGSILIDQLNDIDKLVIRYSR